MKGVKMPVIRTPDERFRDLPGFSFQPHYVNVNGMRIHYVDEGAKDKEDEKGKGEVILCWCPLLLTILGRRGCGGRGKYCQSGISRRW
jgi:hypothetical protein